MSWTSLPPTLRTSASSARTLGGQTYRMPFTGSSMTPAGTSAREPESIGTILLDENEAAVIQRAVGAVVRVSERQGPESGDAAWFAGQGMARGSLKGTHCRRPPAWFHAGSLTDAHWALEPSQVDPIHPGRALVRLHPPVGLPHLLLRNLERLPFRQ